MKYHLIYDMGHTIDSILFDDLEAAKDQAWELLLSWQTCTCAEAPTAADRMDAWDQMIEECHVWITEPDPTCDDGFRIVWEPDDCDLAEMGWLPYDELPEDLKAVVRGW